MILQCPACNARYAVPDHAIGAAGRTVRCVKCAHQWFVAGVQAADAAALEALLKAPEKPEAKPVSKGSSVPAAPRPVVKPTPILMGALAASALLALITTLFAANPGWFGFSQSNNVVLSDLKLDKQVVDKGVEYAVSGNLMNTAAKALVPPIIRITLVDKEGNPLQYWQPVMPEKVEPQTPLAFTFGPLATKFTLGNRLVVELGNKLQLALRSKP